MAQQAMFRIWRGSADGAGCFLHRCAVFGQQQTGHAVIGPRPIDIVLNHLHHRGFPGANGIVQLLDRRFFELKRFAVLVSHVVVAFVADM